MSGPTDREETRRLALSLTAADCVILAAVTAFVTSVPLWSRPWLDAPILFLWSSLPVMASRVPKQNKKWLRSLIIFGLAVGGVLGWQFIKLRVPSEHVMGWELQTALLVFWSSGFLIVQPLTYRLFDALALGALAIGILEGRAWTAPLVGLALLGWFVALAFRHRLFDLSSARLPGRPLRSASWGFLLAGLAVSLFYGFGTAFFGSEDLIRGRSDPVVANRRRIGWGDGPVLSNLQEAQKSDEPFFSVELRSTADDQFQSPNTGAMQNMNWLWRMLVVDSFRGDLGNWEERPVPNGGSAGLALESRVFSSPLSLTLTRISTSVDVFPSVYGTREARFGSSELAGARLVADSRGVLKIVDAEGASFSQGDQVDLGFDGLGRPSDPPRDLHLDLPADRKLLSRLTQITGGFNRNRSSTAAKIESLRAFYRRYFDYQLSADWPLSYESQEEKLLAFLSEHFNGDCNYFALSSCLILRSMNIPARMARGFLGLSWDQDLQAWTIVEGTAHRWTEYHDGKSWQVFDGTQFTRNNSGPGGRLRRDDDSIAVADEAAATDAAGLTSRSFWTRLTQASEAESRSAMLYFLCPILAVLLVIVFKKPDQRSRPKRAEIHAEVTRLEELPELIEALTTTDPDLRYRVMRLYSHWQRQLAQKGRQRRSHETPKQHARRLSHDYPDMVSNSKALAELMDEACYSQNLLDAQAVEHLEQQFRT